MNKITIGFPGLGIDGFTVNKVAFTVFGMEIRWYAIIICVGIISAFCYFMYRGKRTELVPEDEILNATLFTVPIGIVGARLLYVLTDLENHDTFLKAINIRNGGLAIYGGIIFGGITLVTYCLIRKINPLKMLDAIAPAVMIGQVIGRWGNFMNGEAYGEGAGIENLPWRMTVPDRYGNIITVHPTFLYESLWNLIGFLIINRIYKNKKFNGQIFLLYAGWYGLGRACIELLRADSLSIVGGTEEKVWYLKLMVWLGGLIFIAATVVYIILRKRPQKDEVEEFLGAKGAVVANDAQAEANNEIAEETFAEDTTAEDTTEVSEKTEETEQENDSN